VSRLALIIALTFPVVSSMMSVLAGRPSSPPAVGTLTILIPVPPADLILEGMYSSFLSSVVVVIRAGICTSATRFDGVAGGAEKLRKTSA